MKFSLVTVAFTALLTTQVLTAPSPKPLEVLFSIDQVTPNPAPYTVNLRLGNEKTSKHYDVRSTTKEYPIDLDKKEPISYVTLFGAAACRVHALDDSVTYITSFGFPVTVPICNARALHSVTCKPVNCPCSADQGTDSFDSQCC